MTMSSINGANQVKFAQSKSDGVKKNEDKGKKNELIFSGDKNGNGIIDRDDFSDARSWVSVLARGLANRPWKGNEDRVKFYTDQYEDTNTKTDNANNKNKRDTLKTDN